MNRAEVQFHTHVNPYSPLTSRTDLVCMQAQGGDKESKRDHGREPTTG
jgi:hypothetical protein